MAFFIYFFKKAYRLPQYAIVPVRHSIYSITNYSQVNIFFCLYCPAQQVSAGFTKYGFFGDKYCPKNQKPPENPEALLFFIKAVLQNSCLSWEQYFPALRRCCRKPAFQQKSRFSALRKARQGQPRQSPPVCL